MPPDTQQVEGTPNITPPAGTGAPAAAVAAPPATQAQPASEPLPQGMAPAPNGGVQVLSKSAFKELKEKARERGRNEALSDYATSIGFSSVDEMKAALGKLKDLTAPKPKASNGNGNGNGQQAQGQNGNGKNGAQQPNNKGGNVDRFERERQRLEAEKLEAQKSARIAKAKLREAQQANDNREIEMALRQQAMLAGAKDEKAVKFLVHQFVLDMEGKSEDELKAVDEAKWFEDRKKDEPYLFGEVVKPATTGTGAGGAPAPAPGAASAAAAQNGKVDAMKMNPREYRDYLAKRGLNPSM